MSTSTNQPISTINPPTSNQPTSFTTSEFATSPVIFNKTSGTITIVILIIIGIWAAYLSWQSNTKLCYGTSSKLFYSFFAFVIGVPYLLNYYFMKADALAALDKAGWECE
jgi:hypothetical protein